MKKPTREEVAAKWLKLAMIDGNDGRWHKDEELAGFAKQMLAELDQAAPGRKAGKRR